jgi:hypothetical protein
MPIGRVQRELLDRGLRREGLVVPPPRSGREVRAARDLLRRGLVREVPSEPGPPSWREGFALVLTKAGRMAATGY